MLWQKIPTRYLRFAVKLAIFARRTSLWNTLPYLLNLRKPEFRLYRLPGGRKLLTNSPGSLLECFLIYEEMLDALNFEPRRIVDAGAFVGDSTLFFALKYPRALIHAYEASPRAFALAQTNIIINNIEDRVRLFNEALSGRDGFVEFLDSFSTTAHLSTISFKAETGRLVRVPAVSLHAVLSRIGHIDLLKVDIEGSEYLVFRNFGEQEAKKIKSILIEIHRVNGSWKAAERLKEKLLSLGYRELSAIEINEDARLSLMTRR